MKLMLMPSEGTWWTWLITALCLACGLAGYPAGFTGAIVISVAQTLWFLQRHRALAAFPVQIRIAYTALLLVCLVPLMRWLFWLPTLGTFALVLFGYCLMARVLSLMPWNRSERLSSRFVARAFLTPPSRRHPHHGMPGADAGVCACTLEVRAAFGEREARPRDSAC
jgi:hypothetical protein